MISKWLDDDVLNGVHRLQPIAQDAGLTMAQLAVAWVLQNSNVASAIIGASHPEQIASNVQAAGVKLDEGTMSRIEEAIGALAERDPRKTRSPETRLA
jgi:aryl-alcohol dehydrogenase-like predicted oxidoreductase